MIYKNGENEMTVNFDVTKQESAIIHQIAQRAVKMAKEAGVEYDTLDAEMDVTAVHANGNPLRLEEFLSADNFNFAHDAFGIRNNLNRKTGRLKGLFSPRFTDYKLKRGGERELGRIFRKVKKLEGED